MTVTFRRKALGLYAVSLLLATVAGAQSQSAHLPSVSLRNKPIAPATTLSQFVSAIHAKAEGLANSSGMRNGFESFTQAHQLPANSIRYSDYVMVRLLYEATRDAGFWNMHWTITNQPPNSDNIWRQWKNVQNPWPQSPTASAECDELSALYAFLVEREGVRGVGLFWPAPNHTVAVWVVRPTTGAVIRVVVPTSQIFLEASDSFDTRKFNPWTQKTIYEYTRHDAPDSLELPKPLVDFFLGQVDRYAGASDSTLQQLRYLREGVFLKYWTAEDAARESMRRRSALGSSPAEDWAAFWNFAADMRNPHP
jgi:hypothetical protein